MQLRDIEVLRQAYDIRGIEHTVFSAITNVKRMTERLSTLTLADTSARDFWIVRGNGEASTPLLGPRRPLTSTREMRPDGKLDR